MDMAVRGHKLPMRSISRNLRTSKDKITGGASLGIHEEDAPFLTHNGHNSSESKGEDILYRHMLQSRKGKIS